MHRIRSGRKVSRPAGRDERPTGPNHQPGPGRPGQWLQSHITRTPVPPNGLTMGDPEMTTITRRAVLASAPAVLAVPALPTPATAAQWQP